MAPRLTQYLEWMTAGTGLFLRAVDGLAPADYAGPSGLPDWTRKHVVAHLAANAEALGNLVRWAQTGVETPMYSSSQQRADDIAEGAQLSVEELHTWVHDSARQLGDSVDQLDDDQWQQPIRTAQGREVTATEIPWMRAREVFVHSVDLGAGVTFADLPPDFLNALIQDILTKRGMNEAPHGPLPDVTAYLAGRPHALSDVPELGPWL